MVTTSIKIQFVLKEGAIRYERIKNFYEETDDKPKVLLDSIVMNFKDYPLTEIEKSALKILRDSGHPGFVLKENGKLFYSIDRHLQKYKRQIDAMKGQRPHKCNDRDMMCRRLSSLPDAAGGCAKVRDKGAVIEDYDFITKGYEFFNVPQSSFIVLECDHWTPIYGVNTPPTNTSSRRSF